MPGTVPVEDRLKPIRTSAFFHSILFWYTESFIV